MAEVTHEALDNQGVRVCAGTEDHCNAFLSEHFGNWDDTHEIVDISKGFRVWFDNCGDRPHWQATVEGDDTLNDFRPWTEDDEKEYNEQP
jgi:hypothetical protein